MRRNRLLILSLATVVCLGCNLSTKEAVSFSDPDDAQDTIDLQDAEQRMSDFKTSITSSVKDSTLAPCILPRTTTEWTGGTSVISPQTMRTYSILVGNDMANGGTEIGRIRLDSDLSLYEVSATPITMQGLMTDPAEPVRFQSMFVKSAGSASSSKKDLAEDIAAYVGNLLDSYGLSGISLSLPGNISVVSVPPPLPTISIVGSIASGSFPFMLGKDAETSTPLWCVLSFENIDLSDLSAFSFGSLRLSVFSPLIVDGFLICTNIVLAMTSQTIFTLTADMAPTCKRIDMEDGDYFVYDLDGLSGFLRIDVDIENQLVSHYDAGVCGHFSVGTTGTFWHLPLNPAVDHLRFNVIQAMVSDGELDLRVRIKEPRAGRSSERECRLTTESIINPVIAAVNSAKVLKELAGTEVDTIQGITTLLGFPWIVPAALTLQGQIDHWSDPSKNASEIVAGNFIVAYGEYVLPFVSLYQEYFKEIEVIDYNEDLSNLITEDSQQ